MKHKGAFTAAFWWMLACLIAGVFLLAGSDKSERLSEKENRMLAGFPEISVQSLTGGEFMSSFEGFLTDAFFARDGVITLTEKLTNSLSVLSKEEELAGEAQTMEQQLDAEGALQTADETPAPADVPAGAQPDADMDADIEEVGDGETIDLADMDSSQVMTADKSFVWLKQNDGGGKRVLSYSREKIATYADTLRIMQGYLPPDGVICFTQVPLASVANRWTDQQDIYCGWGSSVEAMLQNCLEGTERIYAFDTLAILEPYMTGDVPMFYHTDHHWSAEGAYHVAAEMLRRQGLPVIPYDEYRYKSNRSAPNEKGQTDTFNILYPLMPVRSLVVKHRTETDEISLMNYDSKAYTCYMNNSRRPWRKVITGANTGRKALVISDSFGNAFAPYLLPYYNELHMTDFRKGYYKLEDAGGSIGELIQYFGIDDVYIITSTANDLRKDNSIVYLRSYLQG